MTIHTTLVTDSHADTEHSAHRSTVAVFDTHREAEDAVRALASSSIDMKTLSIVGRDYSTEEGVVGYYTSGDRMLAWGRTGAFWGGLRSQTILRGAAQHDGKPVDCCA